MSEKFKLIVCLDFDGVIHSYISGWKGATTITDDPVPGAFDFIRACLNADFAVHIFSSRSNTIEGRQAMREWVHKHMARFWTENKIEEPFKTVFDQIEYPSVKPPAFISIDDRAIMFNGQWPSMSTIINFKPWYKKVLDKNK